MLISGRDQLLGCCEICIIFYLPSIMFLYAYMFRIAFPHPFQTSPCPSQHTWRACMWPLIRKCARATHFTHPMTYNAMRLIRKCARATHFTHPFATSHGGCRRSSHPHQLSKLPPPPSKIVPRAGVCLHTLPQASHRKGAQGIGYLFIYII